MASHGSPTKPFPNINAGIIEAVYLAGIVDWQRPVGGDQLTPPYCHPWPIASCPVIFFTLPPGKILIAVACIPINPPTRITNRVRNKPTRIVLILGILAHGEP